MCIQDSDPTKETDPVPCACCPVGYTYVDSTGHYNDPATSIGVGVVSGPSPISQFFDSCCKIVNRGWVIDSGPDPLACKCCPTGYDYSSYLGVCVNEVNPKILIDPIPCIPCVCTIPSSVPQALACPTCGTAGEGVNFAYNFQQRNCEPCDPVDFNPPCGKIICFMPNQFSDPNTTFTLKNLNFI